MDCPYCVLEGPGPDIVFREELVWFVQDRRFQGALKHSGVIIPVAHRETVFDLTEAEIAATFALLSRVKAWMDREFAPDGYNVAGTAAALAARMFSTPTCTSSRGSGRSRSPARASARC